jgi:hypothetical protein
MDKSDQDRGKAWARPAYPLFFSFPARRERRPPDRRTLSTNITNIGNASFVPRRPVSS